jgi:hypothetical protein
MPDSKSELIRIETLVFGKNFSSLGDNDRLAKIEKSLFLKSYIKEDTKDRIVRINNFLLGYGNEAKKEVAGNEESGYENYQTKELALKQFEDSFIEIINQQRSFMGALPLIKDDIAFKVAGEQAENIINKNQLSHFDSKGHCPDERYTLAGGTGALIEVLRSFELDEGKIVLNELLINQLIEAISLNTDELKILYNPYITQVGYGFGVSKDKKKFVVVLDFLTKNGEIEPIRTTINLNQKLNLSGKLKSPYKFKAITIGYLSDADIFDVNDNGDIGFNSENMKPYFPPQDYIAFSDNSKSNLIKILSGIGFVAALGGAPFTGGASGVLAPFFLNTIQNGSPKEVPLKGGIKTTSDGQFKGDLLLNYQGMTGLYFVNVIADIPGSNSAIIISRRTVRVELPVIGMKPIEL